jgi:acyl-CoA synthetase (AMP-forming)/AMP-acid ligase II
MLSGTAAEETRLSIVQILRWRARADPDAIAYTFLADGGNNASSLTWAQLDRRAHAIGARLREENALGRPVLIALPSGLAFVESLFACWYAGAIAVPASLPQRAHLERRLRAIIGDSGAEHAMAARGGWSADARNAGWMKGLRWIDTDGSIDVSPASAPTSAAPAHSLLTASQGEQTALLQYTSGSTGEPRGVIISHRNLAHNSAMIAAACGHQTGEVIAGWLPLFHDMGLIGLIVQAVAAGTRCVFMPPERFLMRPWLWLQMISDYRACSSPAPNFAYDLCVAKVSDDHKRRLDLSAWRNALNGSEPVRGTTLDRFAAAFGSCGFNSRAFFPCYGLAESTLFATGPGPERTRSRRSSSAQMLHNHEPGGYVGCGRPYGDTQIAVVDPATFVELPQGIVGEIWLSGTSIARGYWKNDVASGETFGARLAAQIPLRIDQSSRATSTWLRTGDLGFQAGGELFITGRLRDLIIIAGRNVFPIDIERTVEAAEPAVAAAAAFGGDIEGAEQLIVAAEIHRGSVPSIHQEIVRGRIRAAIGAEHDLVPYEITLLRPGGIPRTSNGKISRRTARQAYLDRTLAALEAAHHVSDS